MESDENIKAKVTPEMMRELNMGALKNDLITPNFLYLDLALMRDLQIGAMMSIAFETGETEARRIYSIIKKNQKEYNKRYFLDASYYFKESNYSYTNIMDRLNDSKYADSIFNFSPITKFINIISTHMAINVNHSAIADNSSTPIRMAINTFPLKLSDHVNKAYGLHIADLFGVETVVFCKNVAEYNYLEDLDNFDEFYLYHIYEFSHNKTIKEAFQDDNFSDKKIFAIPICGNTYDPKRTIKSLAEELVLIESHLNIFVEKFKFIPMVDCSLHDAKNAPNPIKKAAENNSKI